MFDFFEGPPCYCFNTTSHFKGLQINFVGLHRNAPLFEGQDNKTVEVTKPILWTFKESLCAYSMDES